MPMSMHSMMTVSMMLAGGLTLMFMLMKEEKEKNNTEPTSFECGFCNMNDKKMMFSTNFMMMIMLFIMFDIEISIMVPMSMKSNSMTQTLTIPMMFMIMLTTILLKEWKTGTLEWSK